jgi:hypothetical protein
MAHNVKVVYDVSGVAMKIFEAVSATPEMWRRKNPQRA